MCHPHIYQPGMRNTPGRSYDYLAIFLFVCFVHLSPTGKALKRVNGRQLARFELAGVFASSLKNEVTRCQYDRQYKEAQVSLHKCERAPEARQRQENGAANYKPDKIRNCNGVTVLCVL